MHWTGEWILLAFIIASTAVMLLLLHLTKLGLILHQNIQDRPRRRMFLASVSFFITFLAVRLLVASIQHHIGPFQYVTMGGRHIHHLVWGILILLGVGYGYVLEIDSRATPGSMFAGRLMAILYGVGAALTLDEFALWLNLANVRIPFRKPAGNRYVGRSAFRRDPAKKITPPVGPMKPVPQSRYRSRTPTRKSCSFAPGSLTRFPLLLSSVNPLASMRMLLVCKM
jgi:hypothetical protein